MDRFFRFHGMRPRDDAKRRQESLKSIGDRGSPHSAEAKP
jgi:hypothetical protein